MRFSFYRRLICLAMVSVVLSGTDVFRPSLEKSDDVGKQLFSTQAVIPPLVSEHLPFWSYAKIQWIERVKPVSARVVVLWSGDAAFKALRNQYPALRWVGLALLADSVLTMTVPWVGQQLYDTASSGILHRPWSAMLFVGGLFASTWLLEPWRDVVNERLETIRLAATRRLREQAIDGALNGDERHVEPGSARLLFHATDLVAQRNTESPLKFRQTVFHMLASGAILWHLHPLLAVIVGVFTVGLGGWLEVKAVVLEKLGKTLRDAEVSVETFLGDLLSQTQRRYTRANVLENEVEASIDERLETLYRLQHRYASTKRHFDRLHNILSSAVLMYGLTLALVFYQFVYHVPTTGQLFAIVSLSWHLQYKFIALGELLRSVRKSQSALDAVLPWVSQPRRSEASVLDLHCADVHCLNVTVSVEGRRILEPVTLHLKEGETLVVEGESGAGKTTLLRVIAGIDLPTSGSVSVGSRPPSDVRREVAWVSQDHPYIPFFSIREHLQRLKRDATLAQIDAALDDAGAGFVRQFQNGLDSTMGTLSEGERQRLELAGALLRRPRLLILDEPASGLDPANRDHLENTLRRLQQQGVTLVVATQDVLRVEGKRLRLRRAA